MKFRLRDILGYSLSFFLIGYVGFQIFQNSASEDEIEDSIEMIIEQPITENEIELNSELFPHQNFITSLITEATENYNFPLDEKYLNPYKCYDRNSLKWVYTNELSDEYYKCYKNKIYELYASDEGHAFVKLYFEYLTVYDQFAIDGIFDIPEYEQAFNKIYGEALQETLQNWLMFAENEESLEYSHAFGNSIMLTGYLRGDKLGEIELLIDSTF